MRCPQKNHGDQRTQQNYANDEEHGSGAQLHVQFAVSRSVDDVDHQVGEHNSSSVFDCAIHRGFLFRRFPESYWASWCLSATDKVRDPFRAQRVKV